jgi:hypothetical protein
MTGIYEMMKRDIVSRVISESRVGQETAQVEELLSEIAKDGKCAYGINEVRGALEQGAVVAKIDDALYQADAAQAEAQVASEDALVQRTATVPTNLVALYKALGGGLTDDGLAPLASLSRLTSITLSGRFTDKALQHLQKLPELGALDFLSGAKFSQAAVREFQRQVPTLTVFRGYETDRGPGTGPTAGGRRR